MQHRSIADVTNTPWPQRSGTGVTKPSYRDENASCPVVKVNNATLTRYFTDHVPVEKEKKTRIREDVLSDLDAILRYVNSRDKHYGEAIRVGSSTQGLDVNIEGDVDCSIVFQFDPTQGRDHPSNSLVWNSSGQQKPRYYGFQYPTQNDISSPREDQDIVPTRNSLPSPEPGYYSVSGFSVDKPNSSGLKEFIVQGDLIPFLVKRKFKLLLQKGSEQLGLRDDMKLSRISHGPALTFKAEVIMSDGERHPVSIDLAVVIRARLPFLLEMGWPGIGKSWPSHDKIDSIRKLGINMVAKKPFDWQLSFAELEKELVREIDKDGGCRKEVHRIMKSIYYTVCKKDATLSTYVLKNAWFLELEKYPDPKSWQSQYLSERYYGCLESLLTYVNDRRYLPQYFNRQINLLKVEKIWDIRNDVEKIRSFQFDQRKRPANNTGSLPTAPQPFKKTKATAS